MANGIEIKEGGTAVKQRYVFRNADGFFRNEFGQKDLHLVLRFICMIVGGVSSGLTLFVFFSQAMGIIGTHVDALPYFYNGLFFMLSAIGDAAVTDFNKHKKD